MRASELRKLARDTIVEVSWIDPCEDSAGNPDESRIAVRRTLGRVWGMKRNGEGVDLFTLTFTKDLDGPEQSGWICLPSVTVREVRIVEANK